MYFPVILKGQLWSFKGPVGVTLNRGVRNQIEYTYSVLQP